MLQTSITNIKDNNLGRFINKGKILSTLLGQDINATLCYELIVTQVNIFHTVGNTFTNYNEMV